MVDTDIKFITKLLDDGIIQSPCLELGVGGDEFSSKELIMKNGVEYLGTDIAAGKNVDYIVDFEDPAQVKRCFPDKNEFGSILVPNVLEHVFNPILLLDNVFSILRKGGTCIIITPVIWPLHNYPLDCWRICPDFYEEYCKRRKYTIVKEYFGYLGYGNIEKHKTQHGGYALPLPGKKGFNRIVSRFIHKVFNTYGRGMFFPSNIGIGAVLIK